MSDFTNFMAQTSDFVEETNGSTAYKSWYGRRHFENIEVDGIMVHKHTGIFNLSGNHASKESSVFPDGTRVIEKCDEKGNRIVRIKDKFGKWHISEYNTPFFNWNNVGLASDMGLKGNKPKYGINLRGAGKSFPEVFNVKPYNSGTEFIVKETELFYTKGKQLEEAAETLAKQVREHKLPMLTSKESEMIGEKLLPFFQSMETKRSSKTGQMLMQKCALFVKELSKLRI